MSQPITVTSDNFEAEVLNASVPVLVDFWADWCGPCKAIAPVLEEISNELSDKLKVVKVDVESSPGVSRTMRIQSIPT
ncbi:MAG: thioredoxin domain-containing protein, partial [Pseudomonadota bacterium]